MNQIIFPKGYCLKGIQLKQFAKTLSLKDFYLVIVGVDTYYTYTYEGQIRRGYVVKIILIWPKKPPLEEKTLRCFMSHDLNLSVNQILKHYTKRWSIETFFRET